MNIHAIWCVMSRNFPYKPIFACASKEEAERICKTINQPLTPEYEKFILKDGVCEVPFIEYVDGIKLTGDDGRE